MNIIKLMTPKVSTVCLTGDKTVRQGLEIFREHGYTAVPVVDENGHYMGSVTEGDFLRHILKTGTTDIRDHEQYYIRDIVRCDFCRSLNIDADYDTVIATVLGQNFAPVVDDRGIFCGILTRRSLIEWLAERK